MDSSRSIICEAQHQNASLAAIPGTEQLPPGYHIDPGETVPHTHDEAAVLPEGYHIDPGETVPHTHGETTALPVETYIVPRN